MFAFQTLGVMADAAEAIATDGDVSSCHVWKHVYMIYVWAEISLCVFIVLCMGGSKAPYILY